jgi:tRNA threonylcarbamoyladenosine biosynthesis protein TsaB
MIVLGLDTATPATVAGVLRGDGVVFEGAHHPASGERPGHATRLLALIEETLAAAGVELAAVERIAVGAGPGSFTGLRIGVATARGLAQAVGAQLAPVSTLAALAAGATRATSAAAAAGAGEAASTAPPPAGDQPGGSVLAVLDARRGEAFAAAFAGAAAVMPSTVLAPDALADAARRLPEPLLAVGDGALRFRAALERAGAAVPPDDDPLHRVSARHVCRLGAEAAPAPRDAVLPDYLRAPDADTAAQPPTR